jgi:hypothetical protein
MTLPAGTKLEPHEVVAPLGASGKGEVYRARNTRLARAAVCQRKFESVEDPVRAYQALTNEEVKPAASHSL